MSDAKQRLALAVNQAIRPRMSLDQIKRLPLGVQLGITQEVDRVQVRCSLTFTLKSFMRQIARR